MSYPPSLSYYVSRLSGCSVNVLKLEPQNATTALPNSVIKVTLPSNSLLALGDLGGFQMHFTAVCTGSGGRLPPDISSLISRVDVSMGGISVSQGCNHYGVLRHMKAALMGSKCSAGYGHPVIARQVNYMNALTMTAGDNETVGTNEPYAFCIDNWLGFLGELDPKLLDSSILPDIVVSIYLAGPEVCTSSANVPMIKVHDPSSHAFYMAMDQTGTIGEAGTGASFQLSDIHFSQKVFGLADSVYDNLVAAQIAERGYVEVPFKQYVTFSDTHSGSTRFSVATQSLDRVYATFRDKDFATQTAPQYRVGYKHNGGFVGKTNTFTPADAIETGRTLFDKGGILAYNKEGLVNRFFNMSVPRALTGTFAGKILPNVTFQFQLNGAYINQFPATPYEWQSLSKHAMPYYHHDDEVQLTYLYNKFVICSQLNLPGSESMRVLSGLSTRAVALQGYLNSTNVTGDPNCVIVCECSSTLRIGEGKLIECIN